jgi:ATP-dependent DNA helicase RecQ
LSAAHTILRQTFGYDSFRGEQQAIVDHLIAGGDALVLMPTGGGKSLCFQIPALARQAAGQGVTIVVSPLIALMHDQVGALHEAGVAAEFLNSSLTGEAANAVEQRLRRGEITMLYAAPERVTSPRFLALLDGLYEDGNLSLFAIDEAHCVSQWGHDFRPEYQALSVLHERYATVPRVALTATADSLTRADIVQGLRLEDARQFVSSFDRPNIRYKIVEKQEATSQLLRFISDEHAGDCGIVYCQSRKRVEEVAERLNKEGINAMPYHAGLPADVRLANQDKFLRAEGWVMVATIAFGMGIDKPDVRFVAHLDMPKNIEGYYQETGRAGRDGLPSNAWMAYGLSDVVNQRRMIDESPARDEFKQVMRGKLDALLGLAEATDCRRVRLLAYFDEVYAPSSSASAPLRGAAQRAEGKTSAEPEASAVRLTCNSCDNCLNPPQIWDATDVARKLLSTIYRVEQHSQQHFGAGHLMDIVRGKTTDKTIQYGHERISTFALCADNTEVQLRAVLRQLMSLDAVRVDAEAFNTLHLTQGSRAVLKGEVKIELRQSIKPTRTKKPAGSPYAVSPAARSGSKAKLGEASTEVPLNAQSQRRLAALKAWRAEVAQHHNLPAFVIFHDSTLRAIAQANPAAISELGGIMGMGAKKLEAYGAEVVRVVKTIT